MCHMFVEKKLTDLTVGHYIVEIAQQVNSLSLSAPGYIKSQAVINNLKYKRVVSVFIDDRKTISADTPSASISLAANNKKLDKDLDKNLETIITQFKEAKELHDHLKNIQKDIVATTLSGGTLDLAPIMEITNKSVDCVFRRS